MQGYPSDALVIQPGQDDPEGRQLRRTFGAFATGVTVVVVDTPDGPVGMTVNSFTSVSLSPALILWSVATSSARCPAFTEASHFSVNVLGSDQQALALAFATEATPFERSSWFQGQFHSPVLSSCLANFECRKHEVHAGGDHLIIVGEVLQASLSGGDPLIFSQGQFASL